MKDETVLLRQIHPNFVQGGRVISSAFSPTPKDKKLLSTYNGDLIKPENAWVYHNRRPNCSSMGIMGITVGECRSLSLPTRPDPTPYPEHAVIDFSDFTNGETKAKAKLLRDMAVERGWLYQATASQVGVER
ncbi:MAG: hypothetical protein HQM03_00070 [Magnetococcales bacterium]|nr:hypothetical protein [Magnetococcales bacterium]